MRSLPMLDEPLPPALGGSLLAACQRSSRASRHSTRLVLIGSSPRSRRRSRGRSRPAPRETPADPRGAATTAALSRRARDDGAGAGGERITPARQPARRQLRSIPAGSGVPRSATLRSVGCSQRARPRPGSRRGSMSRMRRPRGPATGRGRMLHSRTSNRLTRLASNLFPCPVLCVEAGRPSKNRARPGGCPRDETKAPASATRRGGWSPRCASRSPSTRRQKLEAGGRPAASWISARRMRRRRVSRSLMAGGLGKPHHESGRPPTAAASDYSTLCRALGIPTGVGAPRYADAL